MTLDERAGLARRTVVVAGAGGGGIGTATAHLLVACGASVAAIDVDRERLDTAAPPIDADRGRWLPLMADLRDRSSVEAALDVAEHELGPVDGLVQVAGGIFDAPSTSTATQFTVTPSSPHCRAAALARLRVPSAALASGARRAAPVIAIVGTTTTIRPPRWRSTAWLAWRQASIVSSGASHCARHCASEISTSGDVR